MDAQFHRDVVPLASFIHIVIFPQGQQLRLGHSCRIDHRIGPFDAADVVADRIAGTEHPQIEGADIPYKLEKELCPNRRDTGGRSR